MKKEEWVKVGDRFESNSCGPYTILEKNGDCNVLRFDTGFVTTKATACVIKGKVKDPLFPNVFGVGYLGIGEYVTRSGGYKSLPEYNAWINMLQRCYYDKYSSRVDGVETYDNVEVVEDWYNFQNFAGWYVPRRELFDKHCVSRPALDKDILAASDGPKIYGPEYCCLVPAEINGAFIYLHNEDSGILKQGKGYCVYHKSKRTTGYFETIEEARFIRKILRQEQLIELACKYREVIEPRVYDKLCNWFQVQKPLATCLN